jgi:hypothetical protein
MGRSVEELTALNVGARAGVIGERVKMSAEVAKALPEMRMWMTDETGKVLAGVPKRGLQPLDNLPWLIADLQKAGTPLKGRELLVSVRRRRCTVVGGKTIQLHYAIPGVKELQTKVRFTN